MSHLSAKKIAQDDRSYGRYIFRPCKCFLHLWLVPLDTAEAVDRAAPASIDAARGGISNSSSNPDNS